MKPGLLTILKNALQGESESTLHPLEQQMAKHYIKRRLVLTFPELRNDPRALEEAYQSLSIEPRLGTETGDTATYYELRSRG